MKLSIAIAYSILSSVAPAIIATKEDEINVLVKKVEELTAVVEAQGAVVEAQGRTLEQLLSPSQNDRRFLAKSSKSKPTPQPTSSSEPRACLMSQFQCSDLKTNVLKALAHQTADVALAHTEQCQTFKYLLDKQTDEPTVRDNLLKAMHCETVKDVNGTQYEMIEMGVARPDWYYSVTSTDPLGPQYQACNDFVNVGKCGSQSPFYCTWFTNGYIAASYDIPLGEDIAKECADYCKTDPFCKASFFKNENDEYELACNIIHVSATTPEESRATCGIRGSQDCFSFGTGQLQVRVFVKQEVDSDYCKGT
eukprot:scaffold210072_cov61-Cyclotella_meneghiniana.AAC.1